MISTREVRASGAVGRKQRLDPSRRVSPGGSAALPIDLRAAHMILFPRSSFAARGAAALAGARLERRRGDQGARLPPLRAGSAARGLLCACGAPRQRASREETSASRAPRCVRRSTRDEWEREGAQGATSEEGRGAGRGRRKKPGVLALQGGSRFVEKRPMLGRQNRRTGSPERRGDPWEGGPLVGSVGWDEERGTGSGPRSDRHCVRVILVRSTPDSPSLPSFLSRSLS